MDESNAITINNTADVKEITTEFWKTLCNIKEPLAIMVSGKQMSELMNQKQYNQVLKDGLRQILECASREVSNESATIVMMRETARRTLESCENRPECKHCNHSPVCKDELKQNLEGECPYYE